MKSGNFIEDNNQEVIILKKNQRLLFSTLFLFVIISFILTKSTMNQTIENTKLYWEYKL